MKNCLFHLSATAFLLIFFCSCHSPNRSGSSTGSSPSNSIPFQWAYTTPESQGISSSKMNSSIKTLASKGTKKLLILKNDKIICEWYAPGWADSVKGHYTASLAEAIVGGLSLACAMDDNYLSLDQAACFYINDWQKSGNKSKITIRQLASHTSGLQDAEASQEEKEVMIRKGLHNHFDLPGWRGQFWRQDPDPFTIARDSTPVLFIPGTRYSYSNPGIAMLTYAVTAAIQRSSFSNIGTYLNNRIYHPIEIEKESYSIGYGKTFEVNGWDMGPGETSSIPSKWISEDGMEAYLLFSGEDDFSLRKMTFQVQ